MGLAGGPRRTAPPPGSSTDSFKKQAKRKEVLRGGQGRGSGLGASPSSGGGGWGGRPFGLSARPLLPSLFREPAYLSAPCLWLFGQ